MWNHTMSLKKRCKGNQNFFYRNEMTIKTYVKKKRTFQTVAERKPKRLFLGDERGQKSMSILISSDLSAFSSLLSGVS